MEVPRRDRGEGTIFYEKARDRWVGLLDLGVGTDGQRNRPKVVGKTKKIVRLKLDDLRDAHRLGLDVHARNITFADLTTMWLERDLGPEITANTRANYRTLLNGLIRAAIGQRRVSQLRSSDIEAMLLDMQRLGRSARYMRLALNLTRRVLDYGIRRDILLRNVADRVKAPAGPTATRAGLTVDEARRLLATADGHRLGGLVTLSLLLGLRPGEAAALSWDSIDLASSPPTLVVAASLRRGRGSQLSLAPPKTPSSRRTLALPDPAVRVLERQRTLQTTDADSAGPRWHNAASLVFTTEVGTPLDPSNVRRAIATIGQQANLGHVHPHMLRHAAASLMSAAGVPLEDIADTLGHRSVTVTAEVYRHPIASIRAGHVSAMNELAGRTVGAGVDPIPDPPDGR